MSPLGETAPLKAEGPWQFSLRELLAATAAIAVVLAIHRALGTLGALIATAPHSLAVAVFVARKRRLSPERWSQAWGVLGGLTSVPLVLANLYVARLVLRDGWEIGLLPCLGVAVIAWAVIRGLVLANAILAGALLLQLGWRSLPPWQAERMATVWVTIVSLACPM